MLQAMLVLTLWLGAEIQINPDRTEVLDHRLPRIDWIRTPKVRRFPDLPYINVWVAVDERGVVTGAGFVKDREELREEALKLAKAWKYKPFERNGRPQGAVFNDYLNLYPLE